MRDRQKLQSELEGVLDLLNQFPCHVEFDDVSIFRIMSEQTAVRAAQLLPHATAQLRQDIFALSALGFRHGGYFVEFGAADGRYLSNTALMEGDFKWTGILAEPARKWHKSLHENRQCITDLRCVYSHSSLTVEFNEVASDAALSTIEEYSYLDSHGHERKSGNRYVVETISLFDLLQFHGAPSTIDYLSIDTEGSEYDILKEFDFSAYQFGVITCEHNYAVTRNEVLRLLTRNGYLRVLNHISQFDDWYIHRSMLTQLEEAFPRWQIYSDHLELCGPPTPKGLGATVSLLQQSLINVIADRDAHAQGVRILKEEIRKLEQQVEILKGSNLKSLIARYRLNSTDREK